MAGCLPILSLLLTANGLKVQPEPDIIQQNDTPTFEYLLDDTPSYVYFQNDTSSNENLQNDKPPYEYLQNAKVQAVCKLQKELCVPKNKTACTLRMIGGVPEYRDFESLCALVLGNMCDFPDNQFDFYYYGSCSNHLKRSSESVEVRPVDTAPASPTNTYLENGKLNERNIVVNYNKTFDSKKSRRDMVDDAKTQNITSLDPKPENSKSNNNDDNNNGTSGNNNGTAENNDGAADNNNDTAENNNGTADSSSEYYDDNATDTEEVSKEALRNSKKRQHVAYDGHNCPYFCPDTYKPVCMLVNRNYGMVFKYLRYVNHCTMDMAFCANWKDYRVPKSRPPTFDIEYEHLDISTCTAMRSLQFARFTEIMSSMDHYGWILGDEKYSRILDFQEKQQISGKQRYSERF